MKLCTDTNHPSGQDQLLACPEISVWMSAMGCLRTIGEYQVAWQSNTLSDRAYFRSVNSSLLELAASAEATHRFDVVLPVTVQNTWWGRKAREREFLEVQIYPPFWRWYNWWGDYLLSMIQSDRDFLYKLVLEQRPEVENYRPPGDWLKHRAEPALILKP
jgi:hypothetical protein